MLPKRPSLNLTITATICGMLSPFALAQTINWDGDNPVGNFSFDNNWFGNTQPTWSHSNSLVFSFRNNSSQSSLFYDYSGWRDINDIFYASTFSAGLTLSSNGNGINFKQRLENNSSHTQTIGMPLSGGKDGAPHIELNPVNGRLVLNGSIFNDFSKAYNVYGGNVLEINTGLGVGGTASSVGFAVQTNAIVELKAAQSWTGNTTINAGRMEFRTGGSLAGGTVQLGNTSGSSAAELRLVPNGGYVLARPVLVRSGSSGVKTISSINTAGTNELSGGITLNDSIHLSVEAGGTLTLSGAIGGSGGVTVTQGGRVLVSGTANYSGATTINAGTLEWNATLSGSGAGVSTNNNAVLSGNGSIARAVSVASTAFIHPGNSAQPTATLAVGSFTLGGTYTADINWNGNYGLAPSADLIDVTGTVTLQSTSTLAVQMAGGGGTFSGPRYIVLIRNNESDAVSGVFNSITGLSGFTYSVLYDYNADTNAEGTGNDVALKITAVPEPGAVGALLLLASGMLIRRRR